MTNVEPLPTLEELARVLRCNIVTIHRAVKDGEITTTGVRGIERLPWSEWRRLTGQSTSDTNAAA